MPRWPGLLLTYALVGAMAVVVAGVQPNIFNKFRSVCPLSPPPPPARWPHQPVKRRRTRASSASRKQGSAPPVTLTGVSHEADGRASAGAAVETIDGRHSAMFSAAVGTPMLSPLRYCGIIPQPASSGVTVIEGCETKPAERPMVARQALLVARGDGCPSPPI